MKKIILSLLLVASASLLQAQTVGTTTTLTKQVYAGTMTNLFTGPFKISSIVITSTNNATGLIVDSSTNSLVYVTLPYTNTVSVLTNVTTYGLAGGAGFYYTNYFGVVTTITNAASNNQFIQLDIANVVPQQTNNLPSIAVSATSLMPTVINNANVSMLTGIWVTNSSTQNTSFFVTITGQRF